MGLKQVQALPLLPAATAETFALVQDAGVTSKLGVSGLLRQFDVTSFGVSTAKNGAQNDVAIATAIAAAVAQSAELYWPPGAYTSAASLANLHAVRHRGPGRIVRGSDTFYLEPKPGQQNTIYGAASGGSLTNDGITSSQPISTVQKCIDSWANYARETAGTWRIKLAAGTFTEGGVADGIVSATRLVIEGTLNAGVPDTFIDGTGASAQNGLNFNDGVKVTVRYIECRDWTTTPSDSCGFIVQNGSEANFDTCRGSGNSFCDFNCTEFSDMNFQGVIVGSSLIGARYYRLSHGSVGDGTNLVDFSGSDAPGSIGLQVRDTSSVVCNDNIDLSDRDYGAYVWKTSYLELRDATVSSCSTGVRVDVLSEVATSGGTQTMVGNSVNWSVRGHSHNQADSLIESQYDTANGRWLYGASTGYSTLSAVKFQWAREGAKSASQFNGNAWIGIDAGTQATNYFAFSGPANHTSGFIWCDTAVSAAGWFYYNIGGARFRWAISGTERYSLDATGFLPLDDNARDLGSASLRMQAVYGRQLRPGAGAVIWTSGSGSPEGVVTAPVGSLYTDTASATCLYVKQTGAGNTGWVAK